MAVVALLSISALQSIFALVNGQIRRHRPNMPGNRVVAMYQSLSILVASASILPFSSCDTILEVNCEDCIIKFIASCDMVSYVLCVYMYITLCYFI